MNKAQKITAAVAASAVLAVSGCKAAPAPQPNEDEPGWNCHTMGNHQCGPVDPRS